jgi:hypothetical protein
MGDLWVVIVIYIVSKMGEEGLDIRDLGNGD